MLNSNILMLWKSDSLWQTGRAAALWISADVSPYTQHSPLCKPASLLWQRPPSHLVHTCSSRWPLGPGSSVTSKREVQNTRGEGEPLHSLLWLGYWAPDFVGPISTTNWKMWASPHTFICGTVSVSDIHVRICATSPYFLWGADWF